jgi:hypothetical protein
MIGGFIGKPIGGVAGQVFAEAAATAVGSGAAAAASGAIKAVAATATGTGTAAATNATAIFSAAGAATGTGTAAAIGAAIIYLRPDGDTATDGWTDQAGGASNIYQSIDETTLNDTNYVKSPDVTGTNADLTVRLFEGATEIVAWNHTNIAATFTDAVQTLTTPQYDAIANFNNLFAEFDDNQGNVYRFPISNPISGADPPVKIRYRFKKEAA